MAKIDPRGRGAGPSLVQAFSAARREYPGFDRGAGARKRVVLLVGSVPLNAPKCEFLSSNYPVLGA